MPQDGSVVVEKVKRSAHKVVLGWSDERGGARETHGWLGAGDNKEPKEDKWCVFEAGLLHSHPPKAMRKAAMAS